MQLFITNFYVIWLLTFEATQYLLIASIHIIFLTVISASSLLIKLSAYWIFLTRIAGKRLTSALLFSCAGLSEKFQQLVHYCSIFCVLLEVGVPKVDY